MGLSAASDSADPSPGTSRRLGCCCCCCCGRGCFKPSMCRSRSRLFDRPVLVLAQLAGRLLAGLLSEACCSVWGRSCRSLQLGLLRMVRKPVPQSVFCSSLSTPSTPPSPPWLLLLLLGVLLGLTSPPAASADRPPPELLPSVLLFCSTALRVPLALLVHLLSPAGCAATAATTASAAAAAAAAALGHTGSSMCLNGLLCCEAIQCNQHWLTARHATSLSTAAPTSSCTHRQRSLSLITSLCWVGPCLSSAAWPGIAAAVSAALLSFAAWPVLLRVVGCCAWVQAAAGVVAALCRGGSTFMAGLPKGPKLV
jgi:hypothetical protein